MADKVELASGCIDSYNNFFVVKVTDGNKDELRHVDSSGGV
jgi:hypothetical protein